MSVLQYSCTTWTLIRNLEKMEENVKRNQLIVLNKSWKPETAVNKNCPSKANKAMSKILFRTTTHGIPVLAEQQEFTDISPLQTLDAMYRTCQEQWLIGTVGEKESKKFLLSQKIDDDDDDDDDNLFMSSSGSGISHPKGGMG